MFKSRYVALLLVFVSATLFAPPRAVADDKETDEQLLKRYLGTSDAKALLEYLNKQVLTDADKGELKKLIEQMGDRAFKARQEASRQLVKAGPSALALLREALSNPDREIASRAKRCIEDINSGPGAELPASAVRHLVKLNDPKALETFLAIYPGAGTESLRSELLSGLTTLGLAGKQVHASVTKALDDADPARRAAAVQVLLSGDKDVYKPVKAKLKDPDATVRYHAAVGLVATERESIPVLIELIKDSPNPLHWQHAEECLYTIAGEQSKPIPVGDAKADDRKRIAESWDNWWKAFGNQILLGQKEDYPTDVAVVTQTGGQGQARVWEWRPDGTKRFDLKDFTSPVDARVLPGKRILVADEQGNKVSERDFSGRVIWEKTFEQREAPVSVQRLPNGNTFVALFNRVVEVRRDGQIVSSIYVATNGRISDANKFPDGRIACLTNGFNNGEENKLFFLSAEGKVQKELTMESYGGVEALANGHLMVSLIHSHRVLEFDKTGKKIWEHKLDGAWVGTRLPDGNTLIASKTLQKMYKVDKDGNKIWEKEIDGHPHAMHWK